VHNCIKDDEVEKKVKINSIAVIEQTVLKQTFVFLFIE